MIFGPDGKPLFDPVGVGEEAILQADIDLRDIDYAKTVGYPFLDRELAWPACLTRALMLEDSHPD
jgi:hypothetical protein